jgi:serine/threonine protein kinase
MNWMAPEVLERPYDERSDVWSLGCIVLDAATCGFFDVSVWLPYSGCLLSGFTLEKTRAVNFSLCFKCVPVRYILR